MIHVIAILTAKPGMRSHIVQALEANMPAVHAEEGCIEYAAAVDLPGLAGGFAAFGPDTVVVIEKWASFGALQAHGRAPHMTAYAALTREWIADRAIHVLGAPAPA